MGKLMFMGITESSIIGILLSDYQTFYNVIIQ